MTNTAPGKAPDKKDSNKELRQARKLVRALTVTVMEYGDRGHDRVRAAENRILAFIEKTLHEKQVTDKACDEFREIAFVGTRPIVNPRREDEFTEAERLTRLDLEPQGRLFPPGGTFAKRK